MLETILESTDRDLTTTAAVKLAMGSSATSEDAAISALIRTASRWAETYVGYPLTLRTYRESVASFGRRNIRLTRTPIRAVPGLYPTTDTGGEDALLSSEFRVQDREAGLVSRDIGFAWSVPIQFELEPRPVPGEEFRPWMVDYVAGYVRDGLATDSPHWSTEKGTTSTGRTLPEDIEQAVILRAIELRAGGTDVKSEKIGDLEVTYQSVNAGGTEMRQSAPEGLLEPYRRII